LYLKRSLKNFGGKKMTAQAKRTKFNGVNIITEKESVMEIEDIINEVKSIMNFKKGNGLIDVIVQDYTTKQILMLGKANPEALSRTLKNRLATFWSRTRNELWQKGMYSGNTLKIIDVIADCDLDAVIYEVEQLGSGVCHEINYSGQNKKSCFFRSLNIVNDEVVIIELKEEEKK
jgi:phosphoribosyl-AMP cyclohydrolase